MPESLNKLRYLFGPRDWRNAFILLGLMVVGALLEVASVGAVPAFVAFLTHAEPATRAGLIREAFALVGAWSEGVRMLWAALALMTVFIVKSTYLAGFAYLQAHYLYNRQVDLASRLFAAYLHSPYTFHLQRNTAQLVHNTNNEAFRVVADVLLPGLRIVMELLVLATVLTLLLAVEPLVSLALVLLLGLPSGLFFRLVRQTIAQRGHDESHYRGQMIQAVNQGLGGVKDIKVLGRELYFLRAFSDNALGYTRAGKYKTTIYELPRLFLETVAVLAMLAVDGFFIYQGRPTQTIVPVLTLLAMAALRLVPSANRLVNAALTLRWGRPALDAVYADMKALETASGQQRRSRAGHGPAFREAIEFVDVSCRYPGAAQDALRHVSLRIEKGSSVGLVGPSGAGKTTMVDVLLGLLEPTSGCVRVDGRDIREDLAGWQRQIGYIAQHIYLSDDTIRRNVAFGVPDHDIDQASVWAAVEAAQLSELIESLPGGLDTPVGERGIRLSGGQRQRIGIARALYHRPSVLVMDEATSALDLETERELVRAVTRMTGTRTVIAIAHRLSTVKDCGQLCLLQKGRLAASGRFDDLQRTNESFRTLAH